MNTKHGFGRRLSRGPHNSAANFMAPPRHLKLTLPRKPPSSYTGSSAICGSPKSFANNSVEALSGDENGSIARIKGGGKKGW